MPPDRPERIAQIVEQALEAEIGERGPLLVDLCGDDRELFVEVASLLHFQEKARDFIERPAVETVAEILTSERYGLQSGDALNGYKIVSLLGEGGMGEVYLADDTSLGRKVAIKLLKFGAGTTSIIRHFHQEERILAGLTHPNIAQLYGGDVTGNGLPYFVMEYVEGQRLDDYCRDHRLSILQRLELFRKICSAVSYAHQHLVIHRDLKPANIRVTADGEPKLLDFGIAKLLDPTTTAIPEMTMTFAAIMTPEYASPEQVRGENIATTSDVYSLGVVLYELLTGQKPYKIDKRTPTAVARAITEQEPTRPSTAIARSDGSSKSQTPNRKTLRGDLDNIVLKALRKEPERRYASVAQFSDDIRRHLDGLPVIARKDTFQYRATKFIARHRVSVAAAMILFLTLVAGIVTTAIEARRADQQRARAERRFNDVRKLASSFLFEFHDAIEQLPGSTPARELLVKRALEYLDSLAEEAQDDLSLQRELISAYVKVGNVQGNPSNANLGDTAGALRSYRKAHAIAKSIAASDPLSQRPLAVVQEKRADVLAATGDISGAVEAIRSSLAIFKNIAAADRSNAAAQQSAGISYIKTGDVLGNPNFPNLGDAAAALTNYRSSLEIWQALEKADSSNQKVRRFLGMVHERIGTILESTKNFAEALDNYRESLPIREELAAANPSDTDAVREVAIGYEKIGNVLAQTNQLDAALENRHKSLDIFQRLATADRQNVQAQQSLAISQMHLADLLGDPDMPNLRRRAGALEAYQRALAIFDGITRADPANVASRQYANEVRAKIAKLGTLPR
jgi:serine/threonine protein kinase